MDRFSEFDVSEQMEDYISKVTFDIVSNEPNFTRSRIIYLSCPMTNIDDYNSKFDKLKNEADLYFSYNIRSDYIIIDLRKYINNIPKDINASYIDIMFLCMKILELCDIIVYYDEDGSWIDSRGVLSELTFAKSKCMIIFGSKYIKESNIEMLERK